MCRKVFRVGFLVAFCLTAAYAASTVSAQDAEAQPNWFQRLRQNFLGGESQREPDVDPAAAAAAQATNPTARYNPQLRAPSTRAAQPTIPTRPTAPRTTVNPFENRAVEVGISDNATPSTRRTAPATRLAQPAPRRTALPTAPGVRPVSGQEPIVGANNPTAQPSTRTAAQPTSRPNEQPTSRALAQPSSRRAFQPDTSAVGPRYAQPAVTPRQPVVGTAARPVPNTTPGGASNTELPPRMATRPRAENVREPVSTPSADTRRLNAPSESAATAAEAPKRRTEVETFPGPRHGLFDNAARNMRPGESHDTTSGYEFPPRGNYRDHTSAREPVRTAQREEPEDEPSANETAEAEPKTEPEADIAANPEPESNEPVLLRTKSPLLAVETVGPKSLVIGKKSLFRVMLSNRGEATAGDVNVLVKIPAWAEVVNPESMAIGGEGRASQGPEGITWSLKRLQPQQVEELNIELIPRQGTPFDLGVEVTHGAMASHAAIEVREPKLVMNINGPGEVMYGKQVVYKLTLANPGTGDAENVQLQLLPTTPGEAPPVNHRIGTLKAGATKVVELELTARQRGTLNIHAIASAAGGLNSEVKESVLVRKAGLAVTIDGPKFRYAGTSGTFKVKVTNPGNATAENVQITAFLPPRSKFLNASDRGRFESETGRVAWQLSNLAPGAEINLAFECELGEPGATRVQASGTADDDIKEVGSFVTQVEAVADLVLSVRDPRGPLPTGEEMTYEVTIKNRGTKAAENIELVGIFPEGMLPISAAGGTRYRVDRGQIVFEPISTLEPGQQMIVKVNAKALLSGNHVFRAVLQCRDLDTRIATEESTRFYGDDVNVDQTAGRPGKTRRY